MTIPSKQDILDSLVKEVYSGRILNNSHRGDVVEIMVLAALGSDWKLVGLGWHPWDLQRGSGRDRTRIQVKQCAALQIWGPTKVLQVSLGWKNNPPAYFKRDNPGEAIESEGYFCEVIVCGLHLERDPEKADQLDLRQWEFLVIPTSDLERGRNSITLKKALKIWTPVSWENLRDEVEGVIQR